jgi:hypothetical protein
LDAITGAPTLGLIRLRIGPPTLSIQGRVVDDQGAGLAGILVWVADPTFMSWDSTVGQVFEHFATGHPERHWHPMKTDSSGAFTIRGLLDRPYRIAPMDRTSLLRTNAVAIRGGTDGVEIELEEGSLWPEICGRLVTKEGQPVANIAVLPEIQLIRLPYRGINVFSQGTQGTPSYTGVDGRFELHNLPRTQVYLRFNGESIISSTHSLDGLRGETAADLRIVMTMRAHLRVRPRTPGQGNGFAVLDEHGNRLKISIIRDNTYRTHRVFPLGEFET